MNPDVSIRRLGRLGRITLDRPGALNALSLGMIRTIERALTDFEADPAVDAVLIDSTSGRAFCAGGDVRPIGTAPPGPESERARRDFFGAEYALNHHIARCIKPYIAVIDGITMGGGCGLSLHGTYRVSTERTVLAMPETLLGLMPDVGATWFLGRLPDRVGIYAALSALRFGASDLRALGLATHHIGSGSVPALVEQLGRAAALDGAAIERALSLVAADPGPPEIATRRARTAALFAADSVGAIVAALEAAPEPWARAALASIRAASPTSLAVTLRQFRDGAALSLEEALRQEYRLAVRLTGGHDFREGVRAILVDKDKQPRWNPARIEDVEAATIDALFRPMAPDEAELELPAASRRRDPAGSRPVSPDSLPNP